jgi:hypothetical protein
VRDACSQKVSKNPKIVCAQVTLTKTGLSAVRTFSPLGVKVTGMGARIFGTVLVTVMNDMSSLLYNPK